MKYLSEAYNRIHMDIQISSLKHRIWQHLIRTKWCNIKCVVIFHASKQFYQEALRNSLLYKSKVAFYDKMM